jgi:hypothetical protein
METRRWFNPSQPQTLQIAVALFYIDVVFAVLRGWAFTPFGLLFAAAAVAAGFGIANEQRWGYTTGLVVSGLALIPAVFLAVDEGIFELLSIGVLLWLVFPVARFVLLVHPESRNYQRIWFH